MSWVNPRTWSDGELVPDTMLNIHIRDNFNMVTRVLNTAETTAGFGNSGSSPTQVYSLEIGSNILATNGDSVVVEAFGTFAANGANKRAVLYINSNVVADTTVVTTNDGVWHIRAVIRRATSTINLNGGSVTKTGSATTFTITAYSITWSGSVIIEIYLDGDASNDLKLFSVITELKRSGD